MRGFTQELMEQRPGWMRISQTRGTSVFPLLIGKERGLNLKLNCSIKNFESRTLKKHFVSQMVTMRIRGSTIKKTKMTRRNHLPTFSCPPKPSATRTTKESQSSTRFANDQILATAHGTGLSWIGTSIWQDTGRAWECEIYWRANMSSNVIKWERVNTVGSGIDCFLSDIPIDFL